MENLEKCEYCGEEYQSKTELNIHITKAHATKEAEKMRFRCSHCGEVFRSPQHQAAHMKTEHPDVVRKINLIYWAIVILLIIIVLRQFLF